MRKLSSALKPAGMFMASLNFWSIAGAIITAASLFGLALSAPAQDNVTVPKSRLEELERKERELDQLKGDLNKTKDENVQLKRENEKAAMRPIEAPPAAPVVTYVSPPMETLPALGPNEIVESMDLANYYNADASAADRRFLKQKFTVRGEIVGFEKPLWERNYRILLQTPVREIRVICDLLPPPNSTAVFTTNHGGELVTVVNDTRTPLAKVGQKVLVKGQCKGLRNSTIMIVGWKLEPSK